MYGGDCNAATAKAAADVTRVQSQSQETGSGDEGLGLFGFDLSSAETDFPPSKRKKRTTYSPYKEKTIVVQNTRKKRHLQQQQKYIRRRHLLGNCVWLSGRMYVLYDLYGHTYSKSMDEPGKVANPGRGQLNWENECFGA